MNKLDWTKAPDGATHWCIDIPHRWIKQSGEKFFYWRKDRWEEYTEPGLAASRLENATPRP